MAQSGPDFTLADFLGGLSDTVRPVAARPVVVHAAELEPRPAGQVHNPSALSIAGRLPTATFEIFRQTIPAGLSSDMQRHHHETVHYVISGDGHSEIEDETESWSSGDFRKGRSALLRCGSSRRCDTRSQPRDTGDAS